MKKIISICSFIWLLYACAIPSEVPSPAIASINSCPKSTLVTLPAVAQQESLYNRFDFHIRNILADADTIKFQTLKQDFVFCRANNTWTVQPGTLKSDKLLPHKYDQLSKNLINPPYKTIKFQGKTYQYRVVVEPGFYLDKTGVLSRQDVKPDKNKIIFEVISPNTQAPQRQTLYTLKDLQQQAEKQGFSKLGVDLGFPRITASLIHGDRLWWSLAFEQGEGNTGIATIVGYNPQTNEFTLIQPEGIQSQQITDLAITGDRNHPTFWMGTQLSGEGTAYVPANGLVAYRPNLQNPNSGSLTAYTVDNSPIVGAIPDQLKLEGDILWVGTGNGVCKVKWQAADRPESWSCWRFTLMAKLLSEELPLYSELINKTPAATLSSASNGDIVEVLWWNPLEIENRLKGRYEVRYPQGFTVTLDQGASLKESKWTLPPGKPQIEWAGSEWHWEGDRFVRGWDEVVVDLLSVGVSGIGSNQMAEPNAFPNINAIRGDLELLNLTEKSTRVKYFSGWVDDHLLKPYLTVVPEDRPPNPQPNPLTAIANQLQPRSPN